MRKRPFRIFLVFIIIIILAIAAVFVNAALRRSLNDSEQTANSVLRLQGLAYRLSALEWQSISMGQMSSEVVESVQTTRDEMKSILGELERLDPNSENLSKVRQAFTTYDSAMVEEFKLITAGDLEQAHSLDEEQVDPAFNVLAEELTSAGVSYNAKEAQVKRGSDLGFTILLLFISAATAWTFWQFQKVQAASEQEHLDEFKAVNLELEANRQRLEQRVTDRTKALATPTEVSRKLSTILNQKELVTEVVNQVKNAFGYYHTQIYFYDEAKDNLVMAGGTGEAGEKMLAQFHKVAKGRGLVGRAAETNQPVLVSDTAQNAEWLPNLLLPDTKSEAAIPISIGDQVLGVLDVQQNVVNGLQQEDVDALQSIANQVAIAVQNARIFTQAEQQRRQNELILDSAGEGIFGLDEQGNHTFVNPIGAEMLGYSVEELIGKHSHTMWHHTHADGTPFPGEECPIYFTLRNGVHNQGEEYFIRKDGSGFYVTFSSVPILEDDRTVGAVVTFADITQQKREREIIAQRAKQQEVLNLITRKIQNTTSIDGALQITARELGHALGMKQTQVTLEPENLANKPKSN